MKTIRKFEEEIDLCDLCGQDFFGQLTVPIAFSSHSLASKVKERVSSFFWGLDSKPDLILHGCCLEKHLKKTIKIIKE